MTQVLQMWLRTSEDDDDVGDDRQPNYKHKAANENLSNQPTTTATTEFQGVVFPVSWQEADDEDALRLLSALFSSGVSPQLLP